MFVRRSNVKPLLFFLAPLYKNDSSFFGLLVRSYFLDAHLAGLLARSCKKSEPAKDGLIVLLNFVVPYFFLKKAFVPISSVEFKFAL